MYVVGAYVYGEPVAFLRVVKEHFGCMIPTLDTNCASLADGLGSPDDVLPTSSCGSLHGDTRESPDHDPSSA